MQIVTDSVCNIICKYCIPYFQRQVVKKVSNFCMSNQLGKRSRASIDNNTLFWRKCKQILQKDEMNKNI